MATLQIVFHCLCLYVRDEENRIVHVLMPATKGHHAEHFARMKHHSFDGADNSRSLAGWALTLGPAAGSAQLDTLRPQQEREILDLTAVTGGRTVRKELVTGRNDAVTARITLGAGGVAHTVAETFWRFDNRLVEMVMQVVWEMEIDDVEAPLEWVSIGAEGDPPLVSLSALGQEGLENVRGQPDRRMGYRLDVYHATLTNPKPHEMEHHYRAFYEQLLDHDPTPEQLPRNRQEGPKVQCGSGQARLA